MRTAKSVGGTNSVRIEMCLSGNRWHHPRKPWFLRWLQIADELCCCRWEWLCMWRCYWEGRES
jgi:hypothetical protein